MAGCLQYNYTNEAHKYDDSYLSFEKNIHKYIKHILDGNFPSDNPVSDYLDIEKSNNNRVSKIGKAKLFDDDIVLIKNAGETHVIPIDRILYLSAERAYSKIFLEDGRQFLLSKTLTTLLSEIKSSKIIRIHRSYAVNKDKINIIRGNELELQGNVRVHTSKDFREALVFGS